MPRIPPLPPNEWSDEMMAAVAALRPSDARHEMSRAKGRPKGLNALGTLAQHPTLTKAFNTFNGHILFTTTLTPRQRELLVLRVATLRQSSYEWAQHLVLAVDAGLEPDEIARIKEGPEAPGWTGIDRAMLAATDELIGDGEVSDATWELLSAELSTEQLMDLVFTVGTYEMLAMAFRSFGVELDDDLKRK